MGLRIGARVPSLEFEAYVPTEGERWRTSLAELRGSWVVLFFYPREAVSELSALARLYPQFEAEDAIVLAASTHSFESFEPSFEAHASLAGVFYPIVEDTARELSDAFGTLTGDGAALHGTFVIDPDSVVRQASVTAEAAGRSPDETLRILRTLRAASSAVPSAQAPA
ncbi:MAG TPA: redoxin domain-containing protein [Gaiellaceae bacterium]|jgi:alkyl hydroperoxide reductase subunit AhpC|nr:redoxin domain-containing protein [Gaiellaceae bacterium]